MPIAIIIALLLAGGISVGAQSATPGSLLYPVKTGINEQIEQALAFSTEGKAGVHAELAGHRLEEMEEVSAQENVNPDVIARLKAQFEDQAKQFDEIVARLKAQGNDTAAAHVSAAFNDVIATHEALIAKLTAEASTTSSIGDSVKVDLDDVLESLREHKAHNEEMRASSSEETDMNSDDSSSDGNDETGDSTDGTEDIHMRTGTSVNSEHATSGIRIDTEGAGHVGI